MDPTQMSITALQKEFDQKRVSARELTEFFGGGHEHPR